MGTNPSKHKIRWIEKFPIVGHLHSWAYYLQGENELAAEVFKCATHNLGAACFGVVGCLLVGPIGIIVGGIVGGIAIDTLVSALNSECYGYGIYANKMWNLNMTIYDWIDLANLAIKDGLIGLAAVIICIILMELKSNTHNDIDIFHVEADNGTEIKCHRKCPKPKIMDDYDLSRRLLTPVDKDVLEGALRNLDREVWTTTGLNEKYDKKISVKSVSQLKPGDHIMYTRGNTGKSYCYEHHAIVSKVFENEQYSVYEQSSNGDRFKVLGKASIKENIKSYEPQSIIIIDHGECSRAKSEILEKAHYICHHSTDREYNKTYNILGNNCEHFANDCATGHKKSDQVDHIVENARKFFLYTIENISYIVEKIQFVYLVISFFRNTEH